jgi:hypothetical protein
LKARESFTFDTEIMISWSCTSHPRKGRAIGGLVKIRTVNHTPTKPPNWFVNREPCEEVIYGWLKLIVQAGNRSMYFPHRKAKF